MEHCKRGDERMNVPLLRTLTVFVAGMIIGAIVFTLVLGIFFVWGGWQAV
jgi:hypothetical protein